MEILIIRLVVEEVMWYIRTRSGIVVDPPVFIQLRMKRGGAKRTFAISGAGSGQDANFSRDTYAIFITRKQTIGIFGYATLLVVASSDVEELLAYVCEYSTV